jgi:acetyl-CoA acyltransferase
MRDVAVIGAGMTKFGKFLDRSMKDLTREAVDGALSCASIDKSKLEAAVVGNAAAGLVTGQECIRGQALRRLRHVRHGPRRGCREALPRG